MTRQNTRKKAEGYVCTHWTVRQSFFSTWKKYYIQSRPICPWRDRCSFPCVSTIKTSQSDEDCPRTSHAAHVIYGLVLGTIEPRMQVASAAGVSAPKRKRCAKCPVQEVKKIHMEPNSTTNTVTYATNPMTYQVIACVRVAGQWL
ncbi:hypothetical protein PoB_003140300 [Plakobranchus ocellatus]|uniref:Uncharacterized protein n=1 Tax=Plakobranchus ocellatus TaxID=259542 RepID=A0AAV4AC99_9GAST|nr:hypothetical protein PoB_003140300 [Plakobranchus ocellatus]